MFQILYDRQREVDGLPSGAADLALAIPLAVVFWFVLRGLRR